MKFSGRNLLERKLLQEITKALIPQMLWHERLFVWCCCSIYFLLQFWQEELETRNWKTDTYDILGNWSHFFGFLHFGGSILMWNDAFSGTNHVVDSLSIFSSRLLSTHYELQQNSTPRFPPEGFWTCFIHFFAFSRHFGLI